MSTYLSATKPLDPVNVILSVGIIVAIVLLFA